MGDRLGTEAAARRFWEKVDTESSECWLWMAATRTSDGIGVFGFEGKIMYAHRVAWLLSRGVIPDGMEVRRKCGISICVRPSHLTLALRPDPADSDVVLI